MNNRKEEEQPPLFDSGLIVATPGALKALEEAKQQPGEILARHLHGDWGDLEDEDKKENELSVAHGFRILSAYRLTTGVKVWLITEADRSATTIKKLISWHLLLIVKRIHCAHIIYAC